MRFFYFTKMNHLKFKTSQTTRRILLKKKKSSLEASESAVIFIMMQLLANCRALPGKVFFLPPALQDNKFNVDSEIHFVFVKYGGILCLLLVLNHWLGSGRMEGQRWVKIRGLAPTA